MNRDRTIRGAAVLLIAAAFGCSEDSTSNPVSSPRFSALTDSTFAVGNDGVLEVSNFAGRTTIVPGVANVVDVHVEKWASNQADLGAIDVQMSGNASGVRITTSNPSQLHGVSVDLDLTIPDDMRPAIQTGAGDVDYRGPAQGERSFTVGAGTVTLRLPANPNVEVHLSVAAGTIRVDFPVAGQTTAHNVDGVIGTGADGRIVAQVASGSIVVTKQ